MTTFEFIEKAKSFHGEKYDYSKVDFIDWKHKIIITCLRHGDFKQLPSNHCSKRAQGCSECSKVSGGLKRRLSQEIFIKRAKLKHGDKYDYSKTKYVEVTEKVIIICPIHGEFLQLPMNHLKYNCSKCGDNETGRKSSNSTLDFIRLSSKKHLNFYDYSKVTYNGNTEKVIIICPIHGEFSQIASNHLVGHGCLKCSSVGKQRKSLSEFLEGAEKIHGNKFDYSKTIYIHDKEKIEIICLKHGSFFQQPGNHLQGQGCPKCKNSRGEESIRILLEKNNISYKQEYKFKDCKDKRQLLFDFAIFEDKEKINLIFLIEYDGPQHFKEGTGYYSYHKLDVIKKRDTIKNNYCQQNNISLLRISYTEYKNIENILKNFLNSSIDKK